jgi:rod shape determining protein RodA
MFAGPGKIKRTVFTGVDRVLWGIPLAMIFFAGILIASTQREANYADWYQHWITGAVGLGVALLLGGPPCHNLLPHWLGSANHG